MAKYTRCDGTELAGTPVVVILTLAAPSGELDVIEMGRGEIVGWSHDLELLLGTQPKDPRSATIAGELAGCWHISRLFRAAAGEPSVAEPPELEPDAVRGPLQAPAAAPRRFWTALLRVSNIRPDARLHAVASSLGGAMRLFSDALSARLPAQPGASWSSGFWQGVISSLEIQELTEARAGLVFVGDGVRLTDCPLGFCGGMAP